MQHSTRRFMLAAITSGAVLVFACGGQAQDPPGQSQSADGGGTGSSTGGSGSTSSTGGSGSTSSTGGVASSGSQGFDAALPSGSSSGPSGNVCSSSGVDYGCIGGSTSGGGCDPCSDFVTVDGGLPNLEGLVPGCGLPQDVCEQVCPAAFAAVGCYVESVSPLVVQCESDC